MANLRAAGVNVVKRGTAGPKIAIQARRETIIAAGAIWTPWLLQRSGLGPREVLESAGIPVLKDFPGVGANFQGHPGGGGSWNLTNNLFPNAGTIWVNATFMEEARKEYEEKGTGPYTMSRGNQAAFLPLKTVNPNWQKIISDLLAQDPGTYLPESYDQNLTAGYVAQRNITASLFSRTDNAAFEIAFQGAGIGGGSLQRTFSRGTINIDAKNPLSQPLIDYRTLTNPIDVANFVAVFRYARNIMSQDALRGLGPVELRPGKNVTEDAEIEKWLREQLVSPSFAHPSGTAAMMPEEFGGVVGPDLRVWGTRRLSVVDASVMPLIPASHLTSSVYMVAEKVGS